MSRLLSRRSLVHARGVAAARALSLCVLAVFAVSLGFAPSALAAAAPGQIAGTVTSASTAEPIEGVEVCAYTEYLGGLGCAKTEPNG